MENQSFTCSNPKCAKVFTNPLTVQDLSSKNKASYSACPHCLTEIATEKEPEIEEEEQAQTIKSVRIRQTIEQLKEIEPAQQPPAKEKCPHHYGYLKTRSKNENIPEECMTCEKLLECMLRGSK